MTSSASSTTSASSTANTTASVTSSLPGSRSSTRSATATASMLICRGLPQVVLLVGTSGTAPRLSTATAGRSEMYTAGTCATGLRAFFPGSRLLYALDLGERTAMGGTLTVSTCGLTANNTVLYIGTGCPTWAQPFACVSGNDNAATCSTNAFASTLSITATQTRYFVQLGGINSAHVVSGLQWSYNLPSRSPSGSRTRSRSSSRSRSGSRSRSRKAK